ncbi:MAG: MBL fold metallo-hydrolase [Candidatus Hydrogenedentota bacterium]|nr:MAG: MBL fold metallo-hydrolase [Candidatus Hydrogenedentota bacterium]
MIEEISENLYRVEIPLPRNPLKSINSYMITSSERNLIIDTGMNRKACRDAMQAGLSKLGVDLRQTDFFITHLHADHFGLVGNLATENSKIYFNRPDADRVSSGSHWDDMIEFARVNGFSEDELQAALHNHPGYKYGSEWNFALTILEDGDTISIGNYRFRCVQTPGHTRGHMCLYEPDRKFFVSGDHILIDITPNIQLWSDEENPLNEYLASLDKVYKLDIELVLPGHRRLLRNCKQRIQELKSHHQRRADEVLSILQKGSRTAYQVASMMSWDIDYPSWEQFPVSQRWFATGEAIAHLKYLQEKGEIRREVQDGNVVFRLTSNHSM